MDRPADTYYEPAARQRTVVGKVAAAAGGPLE